MLYTRIVATRKRIAERYVASLADIALMKALAYQDREKADDLEDLNFALGMMVRRGETFTRYGFKQSEIEVISEVVETKGDAEAKRLLTQVAGTDVSTIISSPHCHFPS